MSDNTTESNAHSKYIMTLVIYICIICDIEFDHVMAALEHSSICCHVCACASGIKQTADNRQTTGKQ